MGTSYLPDPNDRCRVKTSAQYAETGERIQFFWLVAQTITNAFEQKKVLV